MKMQLERTALVMALGLLAAGCSGVSSAARRAGAIGVGGAAAGLAASALSNKNPTTTAVGAALGAGLTALALGDDENVRQAGFDQGYVQGQSDAIKRQYFLRQALEVQPLNPAKSAGETVYYTMPGPEVTVDGRKLEPHRVSVRVVE
jgi:hypothetical protein